jgi:hypothetical protein
MDVPENVESEFKKSARGSRNNKRNTQAIARNHRYHSMDSNVVMVYLKDPENSKNLSRDNLMYVTD